MLHPTTLHEMVRLTQADMQREAREARLVRMASGRRTDTGSALRTVVVATALLLGVLGGGLII